jgi:Tol biopolymer transport system component
MELFVANADGSNARQITSNGAANFCPYFTADGKRIIFASNLGDPQRREFDLYIIPKTGGDAERITFAPGFDGFPIFSPDGQWLVWASNRANPTGYITNLFIAKWVE